MNVTIKDVARAAQVSVSTVSRVVNGGYPVSEEKRKRVEEAIAVLQYSPNSLAAGLRSRRTKTIGMVVPRLSNTSYTKMISGVEHAVKAAGYNLMVSSTDNDVQQEKDVLDSFNEHMVAALILSSSSSDPEIISPFLKNGIPVVLLDRRIDGAAADLVASNDREASFQIVNHIITKGHRRIAIINGLDGLSITRDRLSGYQDAFNQNGLSPISELQLSCDFTRKAAFDIVQTMLQTLPKKKWPTAIYCTSTSMTEGCMNALYAMGLRIPEDMSVGAFGELSFPAFFRPQVTSISRKAVIMGETAGKLAVQRINQITENKSYTPDTFIIYSTLQLGNSIQKID